MMKRIILGAGLLVAGVVGTAYAGSRLAGHVIVDMSNLRAQGSMGAARNTTDAVQHISCQLHGDSTSLMASCSARNSVGVTVYCASDAPSIVGALQSLTADSYIEFGFPKSGNGRCRYVFISASSEWEPKGP